MAEIVLGPLLRYVGECDATVWVETDEPCEVEVLDHRAPTFMVEGHHYALVIVEGLAPGTTVEYDVRLDGRVCWPHPDSEWPASTIRTLESNAPVELAFGSCRVAVPHRPPFCLDKDDDERGRGVDALLALSLSLRDVAPDERPHALLLLGDQIYADEVSPLTERFIAERRDVHEPPGAQVVDYEEYTRLYWESWRDPAVRWLFSTVSSAMIFDDHDVHDDWNTSQAWIDEIRTTSWWQGRIEAALMTYWVYQHLGNLSPRELANDHLYTRVRDAGDAGAILREFARCADDSPEGARWSYHRDLGSTRLLVVDSRAGRVLKPGHRDMLDEDEWEWIEERSHGDFDHLLIATSLPYVLSEGMHHVEAWNEALCAGAWGDRAARASEWLRQELDLEHWAAFDTSFARLTRLIEHVGTGVHGPPPASIVVLSGDVHHAYLAEIAFRREVGMKSAVYQATCSAVRNALDAKERRVLRAAGSRVTAVVGKALARAAGVPDPRVRWRLLQDPTFDPQVGTLSLDKRSARLRIEKTIAAEWESPRLHVTLERELADRPAVSEERRPTAPSHDARPEPEPALS